MLRFRAAGFLVAETDFHYRSFLVNTLRVRLIIYNWTDDENTADLTISVASLTNR